MYDFRKMGKEHVSLQMSPNITNRGVQRKCLKGDHRAIADTAAPTLLPTLGCQAQPSPFAPTTCLSDDFFFFLTFFSLESCQFCPFTEMLTFQKYQPIRSSSGLGQQTTGWKCPWGPGTLAVFTLLAAQRALSLLP